MEQKEHLFVCFRDVFPCYVHPCKLITRLGLNEILAYVIYFGYIHHSLSSWYAKYYAICGRLCMWAAFKFNNCEVNLVFCTLNEEVDCAEKLRMHQIAHGVR